MSEWFEAVRPWVGRVEEHDDIAAAAPLAGLAATLDHAVPPWPDGEVPPLGHWLYFLPTHRQSELGPDGHARRGGFLPPVPLPRRMWAGGRLSWSAPIPIGAAIRRRSTIGDIRTRAGRSGELCFVTVVHEVLHGDTLCLTEEHDIVYRSPPPPGGEAAAPPEPDAAAASWRRVVTPDPVLLFRYSALTFNGHRIHYDVDYCRREEGYPGLVFHGPLTATLLVDLYLRHTFGARVRRFSFRALRPLFDTAPFTLCGQPRPGGGADLWALTPDGQRAMTAEVE